MKYIDSIEIMKVSETDSAVTGYTFTEYGKIGIRAEVRDMLTEVKAFLTMADYFVVARDAKKTDNTDSLKLYSISDTIGKIGRYLKCNRFENPSMHTTYIAYEENKIVGALVIGHGSLVYKSCYIDLIYVENAYRKKGIAAKLINTMMSDILDIKGLDGSVLNRIYTRVPGYNKPFINLLMKLGFSTVENGNKLVCLEKKIWRDK